MTTALNLMRKDLKRPRDTDLSAAVPSAAPDADGTWLSETLRELPHQQRAAVLLHYIGDLRIREVAEVMGVAEGTVKALLSQARERLRATLGGQSER